MGFTVDTRHDKLLKDFPGLDPKEARRLKLITKPRRSVVGQRKTWANRIASGMCRDCGSEPLFSKTLGQKCLNRVREYYRSRGAKPWKPGGTGQPPTELRGNTVNVNKFLEWCKRSEMQ